MRPSICEGPRVRIFGIDPGSVRTGYGCIESDGSRHRMVSCGAIAAPSRLPFPERLHIIHSQLADAPHRVPSRRRRGRIAVSRGERQERAAARSRARRRAARGDAGAACRSPNIRRWRSSGRWWDTAAPRSRRWRTWSACCSDSPRRRIRSTCRMRWRWRSVICTRSITSGRSRGTRRARRWRRRARRRGRGTSWRNFKVPE